MKPLILVTALLLAAPAMAETPAPAAVKADASAKPADPDKPVCKEQRIEGTRFLKRVCMTRAAWTDLEQKQGPGLPAGFATPDSPAPYNPSQTGRGTPMH